MGRRVDIPVEAWGATTTENAMVMANFVSEMSNGSFLPRRAEGILYEQSIIWKGGQTNTFTIQSDQIGPNQVAADLGRQTDRKSVNEDCSRSTCNLKSFAKQP